MIWLAKWPIGRMRDTQGTPICPGLALQDTDLMRRFGSRRVRIEVELAEDETADLVERMPARRRCVNMPSMR